MFEFMTNNSYGTNTEWGYGFTFAAEEREHDIIVELLRKHAANGYLRTIELSKVYAQNETSEPIIMKKGKLDYKRLHL